MQLWMIKVVWPAFVRACKKYGRDENRQVAILNIDVYPVHTSEAFITWMRQKYPRFRLIFVPAKCTSKAQFADVVLNKPLKNYVMRNFTLHMVEKVKAEKAVGKSLAEINFQSVGTQVSNNAMRWLLDGYKKLGEIDHQPGLQRIGYPKCWTEEFQEEASLRNDADPSNPLLQPFIPDVSELENVFELDIDDEDWLMAGDLMQGLEKVVD